MKKRLFSLILLIIVSLPNLAVADIDDREGLARRYDLREEGLVTEVRNQDKWGSCWAFSSTGALESHILKTSGKSFDFSENNMDLNHGFYYKPRAGGNRNSALAYLLRGDGPVLEKDDPYILDLDANGLANQERKKLKGKKLVKGVKYIDDVNESEIKNGNISSLNDAKNSIMDYGAIVSLTHHAQDGKKRFPYQHDDFYNSQTASYYYNGDKSKDTTAASEPNHSVLIVGWDDDYSKDNFTTKPLNNGAWICKDAQGKGFGDGGYYYVSYETPYMGKDLYCFTKVDNRKSNDLIFQHDDLGYLGKRDNQFFNQDEDKDVYFNVFDGEDGELKSLGFYSLDKNVDYKLYFIEDFEEFQDLDGELENILEDYKIAEGTVAEKEYHTVDIAPQEISESKKFAIGLYLDGDYAFETEAGNNKITIKSEETFVNAPDDWKMGDGLLEDVNPGYGNKIGNIALKGYASVGEEVVEDVSIVSVEKLESLRLEQASDVEKNLVEKVRVSLSNGEEIDLRVIWQSFDRDEIGSFNLLGEIVLEDNILNIDNINALQEIEIYEKETNKVDEPKEKEDKDSNQDEGKDKPKEKEDQNDKEFVVDPGIAIRPVEENPVGESEVDNRVLKFKVNLKKNEVLFVGDENGELHLVDNITRAELATLIERLAVKELDSSKYESYSDLYKIWYRKGIEYVLSSNIMIGYENNLFKPNKEITRAEFIKVISNLIELDEAKEIYFKDIDSHWASGLINSAYEKGLINGYGDGNFYPEKNITRKEVKIILDRLFEDR